MNSLAVLTFESPSSLEEVFTSPHHAILKDCLISVQTACHLSANFFLASSLLWIGDKETCIADGLQVASAKSAQGDGFAFNG
jgi:hypothetical protein